MRQDNEGVINMVYNRTIRPFLPRKIAALNGVPVRRPRLFDKSDVSPNYEQALIKALRENVTETDDVVIIGGGLGVSAVVAARNGSHVTVFEASKQRYRTLFETIEINDMADSVTARNALVGPRVSVKGSATKTTVEPSELPECDVLELDCEGAELSILRNLAIRPRVIICETHGLYDSPESEVRSELSELGYEIINRGAEVAEEGVYVLTAVRMNGPGGADN